MTSIITNEIEERYPYPDNGERPVTQTRLGACLASRKAYGAGLGEQAQLGEQEAQTVTQEVRHTGDVKRLCLTVKTGGRIDAITCQVLDDMTGALS